MTKEQEARILSNQACIMIALAQIVRSNPIGGEAMAQELRLRVRDIDTYTKEWLK